MIDLKEFLQHLSDTDTNHISTTSLALECSILDLRTDESKSLATVSMQKPVISIERHGEYIQLDFKFISPLDTDLKIFWNTLELYGKTCSDINVDTEDTGLYVTLSLALIPDFYEGKYFAAASEPVFWALTSENIEKSPNIIRVMLPLINFEVLENTSVDIEKITKEVKEEIAYEKRVSAQSTLNNNTNSQI